MLYQGSKSEDSWYFYINTMNDSTFAFNFTRNYLQVHEENSCNTFQTAKMYDSADSGPGSLRTELHSDTIPERGVQWQHGQLAEQNPSLLNLTTERKQSMYQNHTVSYRNRAMTPVRTLKQ